MRYFLARQKINFGGSINLMHAPVATRMKFSEVSSGMKARVVKINPTSPHLKRLQEMGLVEGTEFKVNKIAPFGDPIEISLRGYRLCLRKRETDGIEIERAE